MGWRVDVSMNKNWCYIDTGYLFVAAIAGGMSANATSWFRCSTAAPTSSRVMNIALVASLTAINRSGVRLPTGQQGQVCGALLARRHIFERDGSIIPQLATLPDDFNITFHLLDTQSLEWRGIDAYRHALFTYNAHIILGPDSSTISIPLAYTASLDVVPTLSYETYTSRLSSKTTVRFPTFPAWPSLCCGSRKPSWVYTVPVLHARKRLRQHRSRAGLPRPVGPARLPCLLGHLRGAHAARRCAARANVGALTTHQLRSSHGRKLSATTGRRTWSIRFSTW